MKPDRGAALAEPPFSLQPDDQAFREGAPMIPFDGRRNSGAPEYFAELTKDRRLLTSRLLKPNVGVWHSRAASGRAGIEVGLLRQCRSIRASRRTAALDPKGDLNLLYPSRCQNGEGQNGVRGLRRGKAGRKLSRILAVYVATSGGRADHRHQVSPSAAVRSGAVSAQRCYPTPFRDRNKQTDHDKSKGRQQRR